MIDAQNELGQHDHKRSHCTTSLSFSPPFLFAADSPYLHSTLEKTNALADICPGPQRLFLPDWNGTKKASDFVVLCGLMLKFERSQEKGELCS